MAPSERCVGSCYVFQSSNCRSYPRRCCSKRVCARATPDADQPASRKGLASTVEREAAGTGTACDGTTCCREDCARSAVANGSHGKEPLSGPRLVQLHRWLGLRLDGWLSHRGGDERVGLLPRIDREGAGAQSSQSRVKLPLGEWLHAKERNPRSRLPALPVIQHREADGPGDLGC
jgi:hypothetical protein